MSTQDQLVASEARPHSHSLDENQQNHVVHHDCDSEARRLRDVTPACRAQVAAGCLPPRAPFRLGASSRLRVFRLSIGARRRCNLTQRQGNAGSGLRIQMFSFAQQALLLLGTFRTVTP